MQGTLLAYIGPETVIPATSILAAALAMLLTFGKWLLRPIRGVFRLIVKR